MILNIDSLLPHEHSLPISELGRMAERSEENWESYVDITGMMMDYHYLESGRVSTIGNLTDDDDEQSSPLFEPQQPYFLGIEKEHDVMEIPDIPMNIALANAISRNTARYTTYSIGDINREELIKRNSMPPTYYVPDREEHKAELELEAPLESGESGVSGESLLSLQEAQTLNLRYIMYRNKYIQLQDATRDAFLLNWNLKQVANSQHNLHNCFKDPRVFWNWVGTCYFPFEAYKIAKNPEDFFEEAYEKFTSLDNLHVPDVMNEQEVNNLYAFYWKYLSKGRQLENKKYSQSMKRPRKSIDSNHVERERKSKGRNIDEVLEDLEEERLLNKLDFLNISGNISQRMRAAYENNSPHIDISSNRQTLQEKYSDQECHSDSSDEDSSDQETNKYEAFRYPSEYLKDLEVNYENYLNKPNNIMLHMSHQTNSLMRKYARLQRDHEQYLSTRSDSACILCHTIDESTNNIILTCSRCCMEIHSNCYGVGSMSPATWICDMCQFLPSGTYQTTRCALCTQIGGSLKLIYLGTAPTLWGRNKRAWIHLSCAVVHFGILSGNTKYTPFMPKDLKGVEGIGEAERWRENGCHICRVIKQGLLTRCPKEDCGLIFHVECGINAESTLKWSPPQPPYLICPLHKKATTLIREIKCREQKAIESLNEFEASVAECSLISDHMAHQKSYPNFYAHPLKFTKQETTTLLTRIKYFCAQSRMVITLERDERGILHMISNTALRYAHTLDYNSLPWRKIAFGGVSGKDCYIKYLNLVRSQSKYEILVLGNIGEKPGTTTTTTINTSERKEISSNKRDELVKERKDRGEVVYSRNRQKQRDYHMYSNKYKHQRKSISRTKLEQKKSTKIIINKMEDGKCKRDLPMKRKGTESEMDSFILDLSSTTSTETFSATKKNNEDEHLGISLHLSHSPSPLPDDGSEYLPTNMSDTEQRYTNGLFRVITNRGSGLLQVIHHSKLSLEDSNHMQLRHSDYSNSIKIMN